MQARSNLSYKREMKEVYVLFAKNKKRRGKPHVYIPLCPRGPCAIMICVVIAALFAPLHQLQRYSTRRREFFFVSLCSARSFITPLVSFLYCFSISLFVRDRIVA
ncbi:hypothetical protein BDV30DRAFT_46166 [Aspergillus minisclerotigenes]|uniref:Transmembrane protein n=1 Tax=Aspergillus minisclerotigenes TaxID=656917 RepID=A0A5N6ILZ8_9EURO|nr:hypothetical protein BDV30DRAFT_46166 [Aspergillus minisclerotigenes]